MARLSLLWGALALFSLLALQASAQAPPPPTRVSSPAELLQALEDPAVASIAVVKPMQLSSTWGPARINRQLLITSPMRAMIDWCDEACNTGKMTQPLIILDSGAMVTFNRLFFRNFIPTSRAAFSNPELDFSNSPVPMIVGQGGQVTYNLVVLHWSRSMLWVFNTPGTFWAAAGKTENAIVTPGLRQPLQLETPQLYAMKQFSVDGSSTMSDCYMPFDLDGCLSNQPFNTTLIYCPYTFKDSLRNPWVDHVLVFHNIGLDRLVNSYRDPVVINRTVEYVSCPGTVHKLDLDNITTSVVVTAGGSLTFKDMIIQGSKSQNKTDWPSNVPLLLSTFKPIQSGTITLRDSTVLIQNMDNLIRALHQLPDGSSTAVEIPNLQPTYVGAAPQPGDHYFTIKIWQLQLQRFLLTRAGGQSITDRIGSGNGMASWQFFNVSVGSYTPVDCFDAAVTQGSLLAGRYSTASSGQELLDQLANATARYIRVDGDIELPANLPRDHVTVSRIVEVRACVAGNPRRINWNNNDAAINVAGNAIFEGNMEMHGLGWGHSLDQGHEQLVKALHPAGTGVVELEDVTLFGKMPPVLWANDAGEASMAAMLDVPDLSSMPLNMTLLGPAHLLLRGFYMNRSLSTGGQDGLESFLDVTVVWEQGVEEPGSAGVPVAAVVAPIVVGAVLLLGLLGFLCVCCLRRRRRAAATGAGGGSSKCPGTLLPKVHADVTKGGAGGFDHDSSAPTSKIGAGPLSHADSGLDRTISATSSNISKARSGPSQDIMQATRNLVLHKTGGDTDELVLQSVLGEGSFGKVFKATWRGTVVAVKIMVLPSYMTGKEKREKMAVMETAISSSLSHPNVVQTYTYAVEPVRANTTLSEGPRASGPGASISMHDSTHSWGHKDKAGAAAGREKGAEANSGSGTSAFSWEVRLVQEFCDLGSLRDALKASKFREEDGSPRMALMVDTALDVARAMAHLHHHNILHSDLKARNVLLRSDAADPRGFAAKVADFGLSLTIDPHSTHISNAYQGTMTHMAPETLMHGQLSRASDVYAYGIMLWELFTGEHAYKGVPRALLGHNITRQGMRPVFPADTPFEWQFLACRCWETDAGIRPTFDQILEELKRLKLKWACPGSASPASASPPTSASLDGATLPATVAAAAAIPGPPLTGRVSGQPLPSIADTSDTLPTAVDQALWNEHHQQALQQQELMRRASAGAAGAAAAAAAGQTAQRPASLGSRPGHPQTVTGHDVPGATEASIEFGDDAHLTVVDEEEEAVQRQLRQQQLQLQQQRRQQQQLHESTEDATFEPPSGLMLLSTADSMSAVR